jgi:predicted nucleic acid-binding protein
VAICGVVRAEILCGARNAANRSKLLTELAAFQFLQTSEGLWDAVGDNLAELQRSGLTVPFPDAVIATLGIDLNIQVWSRDPHFLAMQRILPALKLFQEPPLTPPTCWRRKNWLPTRSRNCKRRWRS